MARCLKHVAASTDLPDVVVVDSSEDAETRDLVASGSHGLPADRIRYLHSSPGLPHQRNVGLEATTTEFVHFIDDDSYVTPDYFARIMSTFAARPDAVAVGGLQLGAPLVAPHWTKRLFLLDTQPGRVSKAGANSLVYSVLDNPQEVDWLSGCAMSFRTRAAVSTQFNDALPGYALGEDLEFCLRVSRHGPVLINPEAWVDHVRSDTNRLDYRRFRCAEVAHRGLFVRSFPERFSWAAYAWSILGLTLLNSVRCLRGAEGAGDELRGIVDGLRILRSGRAAS